MPEKKKKKKKKNKKELGKSPSGEAKAPKKKELGKSPSAKTKPGPTKKEAKAKAVPKKKGLGKSPCGKAKAMPKRRPAGPCTWYRLGITRAAKPERAYILGTLDPAPKAKRRLIIEISRHRSELYENHIETLLKMIAEKGLTKEQAWEERERLCNAD